jgi:hypothetical protein
MINKYNTSLTTDTGIIIHNRRNKMYIMKGNAKLQVTKTKDLSFDVRATTNGVVEEKRGVSIWVVYEMIRDRKLDAQNDIDFRIIDRRLLGMPSGT